MEPLFWVFRDRLLVYSNLGQKWRLELGELMTEMARSGVHHADTKLIAFFSYFTIFYRTTRLRNSDDTGFA